MQQTSQAPTVLLVEDELFIRMVSADLLTDAGYRVIEAENAAEAITILESAEHVELLFTDIRMPGEMDGLQLAEFVHSQWPDIRLLVTSGHCNLANHDIPDGGRFVPKPYRVDAVLREIEAILHIDGHA